MCDNTYYSPVTGRTLQEELKQSKPFHSLEEEAFLNIARTHAVLEHALAQALKPFDITPTQYNVLRILRGAGADGLCRNEVGERLVRRVPDVTRLLDRMEEMGLVGRVRGGEDQTIRDGADHPAGSGPPGAARPGDLPHPSNASLAMSTANCFAA